MSMYDPQNQPTDSGWQGQPSDSVWYTEESQATIILVFGILGLVFCQIFSPIAWVMGNKEMEAIDAGRRTPENRQQAMIGRILGIIGTVLVLASIVLGIVAIVVFSVRV